MFNRRSIVIAIALTAIAMLCAAPLAAQTQAASLRVDIHDTSGAIVSGARVELTSNTGAVLRTLTTDHAGRATAPALTPGIYTAEISAAGFRRQRITEIALAAGSTQVIAVELTPGGFADAVIVAAAREIAAGGTSQRTLDGDAMRAQPSLDRDVLSFVQQTAGVSPPAPGSRLSTQGNSAINSSGAREAANNFLIDGLDNNDLFLNRLIVNPSLDAVSAVTIKQNTFDAEFGRSAGARIDMVLKSGTSVTGGSAYEFFRPSPRHLFGGTLGGPVRGTNSTFYFVSAEGIHGREEDVRSAHVPTLAERAGDFSASGTAIVDPFTGRAFPGNIIPANRISETSRRVAALYPLPNQDSSSANFAASPNAARAGGSASIKLDRRFANDALTSVRYSFSNDSRDFPFVARNRNLPGFGVHDLDRGHSIGVSLAQALSPRIAHTLRAGMTFSRRDNVPLDQGTNAFSALGIAGPALGASDLGAPTILVSGFETLGDDANLPVVRSTRTLHAADALTFELHQHQLKIGAELRTFASDGYNHLFSRGRMSFSGAATGSAFADLLLGYPSFSLLAANDNLQALRTWSGAGFVQDEWRVTRALTLNAGIRYEFNAPPTDRDNRMRVFDLTQRALVDVGTNGAARAGINADLNNIAPRVSASWNLSSDATTVLRAGYGIFYDTGTLIENSALYFNPPYYSLQLYIPTASSPLRIEDPFPVGRGINPVTTVNSLDPAFRTAYTHQFTTSLEQRLGAWTGTARYVAAFGRNLVNKRNINQPTPGVGAIDARRPIAGFGDILIVSSQATSTYHGLQVSVDRPITRGLELHAAYTLSKSMDDGSAFLASDGNDNTPQDSSNLDAEWGPSDFDVRHRFVTTLTWLPESTRALWRNWQIAAVVSAQSGRPFTPRLSTDNSNTGNTGGATFASDRPDVLIGAAAAGQTVYRYGGAAFVMPAKYTFGTARRNMLTGPRYMSVDALVARRLQVRGKRFIELRAEVFNLFNRRNGQLPDSFIDHATFGQSLASFPRRQFQFAARFSF